MYSCACFFYILLGLCSLRNHAIHTLVKIPRALDKLVTKETAYYGVSQSFDARLFLSHATTDKQLNDYIIDQARKFVEALIFGEEYWILAILPENIAKNLSRERNGYAVTIPVQSVQYVQSSRLLRDYCKRHAYRPWSLESYRFSEGGFRTCHPLAYSRHFTRCNAQYTSSGDLSSLVFKIACYKTYSKNDQQEILNLLLDNKEVQDIISMKIINKSTRR